jgi:hypothetical protein
MDKLSLRTLIEAALVEAKELHHIAVSIGVEKDENWPKFYADVVVRRLTPIATGMQAHPVAHVTGKITVDGVAIPQADGDSSSFVTREIDGDVSWEIDTDTHIEYPITSRTHVGE